MIPSLALSLALSVGGDWTALDTALITTLAIESAYDVSTTRYGIKHFGPYFQEQDPSLGKHPDAFRLYGTTALVWGLGVFVARILPHPWREIALSVAIAGETVALITNPKEIQFHFAF